MHFENEIRAAVKEHDVPTILATLSSKGYVFGGKQTQHDTIFITASTSFQNSRIIRLRTEGERTKLTLKGKDRGSASTASRRFELNVPVTTYFGKKILGFLPAFGYTLCFQVEKKRTLFMKGGATVSFDEWPLVGFILEIKGTEESALGISKDIAPQYAFGNRRLKDFFADILRETGKSPEELIREHEARTGINLWQFYLAVLC
jgi:predicted adenylyl cyclase CyaB